MAHSDRSDLLNARNERLGPPLGQGADDGTGDGSGALQLDMFGAPPQRGCGSDLAGMRAELREILGEESAAEAPHDDAAQLRLDFLRAELARLDVA